MKKIVNNRRGHLKVFLLIGGTTLVVAGQWAALSILIHFGAPEEPGILGLGFAVSAPLQLFFGLHLRTHLTANATQSTVWPYVQLRILGTAFFCALFILIAFLYRPLLVPLLMIGLAKAGEGISEITHAAHTRLGDEKKVFYSQAARSLLMVGSFAYGATTQSAISVSSALWAFSSLLVASFDLLTVLHLRSPRDHKWSWPSLYKLAISFIPLGFVAVLESLSVNALRYALEYQAGLYSLGVLTVLYYFITAGNIFFAAITHYYLARFSTSSSGTFIAVICTGSIFYFFVLFIFGEDILSILYGKKYSDFGNELTLISATGSVAYINYALWSLSLKHRGIPGNALALVISTLLSLATYFLLPKLFLISELLAAASALLIGRLLLLGYYLFCHKHKNYHETSKAHTSDCD